MGFWSEFKEFAVRGNVVDMAVGVVLGGAFGKIVTSLVNDVIMPPIGHAMGGVNFSDLKYIIGQTTEMVDGVATVKEASINYGLFIQTILDFLIIAMCIFLVIKGLNKLKKAKEEAAPAEPSEEVKLLTEIRDSLKNNK